MDYKRPAAIDLHIHSTASDGTLSPSHIISLALDRQLKAIAITDHDTIDGVKEVLTRGIPSQLKFLSGIEISAMPPPGFHCPGSFHILGYGIDVDTPLLNETLDKLQTARRNRNPQIIKRLNDMGVDISLEEIHREVGDGQLGRPHIARVMIKKGYCQSIDEVFDNYLGKNKPAYVDKFKLTFTEALSLISKSDGLAVLAHPYLLEMDDPQEFESLIITMKNSGLRGLEVFYPDHTPAQEAFYAKIATRYNLIMTGGTDFHGKLKPEIQIGSATGRFFVPYEIYENLVKHL